MELFILLVVVGIVLYFMSSGGGKQSSYQQLHPRGLSAWESLPRLSPTEAQQRNPIVVLLEEHATQRTGITIDYEDSKGTYRRGIVVHPELIFRKSGYPYLYFAGFSEFHGEVRTFRVDRVRQIHS